MRHRIVLALVVAVAAGCSASDLLNASSVGPAVVVTATGDSTRIAMPDTIARSVAHQVQFFTFGSCRTVDASRTDVRLIAADTIEIRPYDREGSFRCGGDVLKLLPHVVAITFNTTGRNVIRIVGERGVLGEGARTPAVVDRTVIVR